MLTFSFVLFKVYIHDSTLTGTYYYG